MTLDRQQYALSKRLPRFLFAAALGLLIPAIFSVAPRAQGTAAVVCPRNARPLEANSLALATLAALKAEGKKARPLAVGAWLAPSDDQRGAMVRAECGAAVWRKTVVVYIRRQSALPAQSASQGVDFVARLPTGYRVWQVAH
jgi:hypothetical protein